jgi:hypothetical protein
VKQRSGSSVRVEVPAEDAGIRHNIDILIPNLLVSDSFKHTEIQSTGLQPILLISSVYDVVYEQAIAFARF